MITRGIVEELLSDYTLRVRIPVFDGIPSGAISVGTDSLNIATVCAPPGIFPSLNVGDVVFLGFEDHDRGKPVVLGVLYNDNSKSTRSDISAGKISSESSSEIGGKSTMDGNLIATKMYVDGEIGNIKTGGGGGNTEPYNAQYKAKVVEAPNPITKTVKVQYQEDDVTDVADLPFTTQMFDAKVDDKVWVTVTPDTDMQPLVTEYRDFAVFGSNYKHSIIMVSENNVIYKLSVSDAGVISTKRIRTDPVLVLSVNSSLGDVSFTISGSSITVDFGDGTDVTYATANNQSVTHTYANSGIYEMSVDAGNITAIKFQSMACLVSVDSPLPPSIQGTTSLQGCFGNCTNLERCVPDLFKNCSHILSMNNCFSYCHKFLTIPQDFFKPLVSVTDYYMIFRGIQGANFTVPEDIFMYSPEVVNMQSAFYTNYGLVKMPSLENNKKLQNLNMAFFSCNAVTGEATEVWNTDNFPNLTAHNQTFYNCIQLSNYSSIPSGWK